MLITIYILLISLSVCQTVSTLTRLKTYIKGVSVTFPTALLSFDSGSHEILVQKKSYLKFNVASNVAKETEKILSIQESDYQNYDAYGVSKSEILSLIFAAIKYNSDKLNMNCAYDDNIKELLNSLDCDITQPSKKDEMINCVDTTGKKICVLPRSQVHNHNILHNGIGALIASKSADDKEGSYEFFVHKRSNEKRLFPSMNDMLIGGVCGTDEAALDTLYRELKEELNIVITPKHKLYRSNLIQDENDTIIIRLGHKIIKTTYNHCYVDCYLVVCSEFHRQRIQFNDGEIQSGKWMTSNDLIDEVEANPNQYVPDGLQIWRDIGKLLELASVKYA